MSSIQHVIIITKHIIFVNLYVTNYDIIFKKYYRILLTIIANSKRYCISELLIL